MTKNVLILSNYLIIMQEKWGKRAIHETYLTARTYMPNSYFRRGTRGGGEGVESHP